MFYSNSLLPSVIISHVSKRLVLKTETFPTSKYPSKPKTTTLIKTLTAIMAVKVFLAVVLADYSSSQNVSTKMNSHKFIYQSSAKLIARGVGNASSIPLAIFHSLSIYWLFQYPVKMGHDKIEKTSSHGRVSNT